MVRRGMRLVMVLVAMLIRSVMIGCALRGLRSGIAVMHLRQQVNPEVIAVVNKQNRRQQAHPPPARTRAGQESASLTWQCHFSAFRTA